jgi:hypothetical protein
MVVVKCKFTIITLKRKGVWTSKIHIEKSTVKEYDSAVLNSTIID